MAQIQVLIFFMIVVKTSCTKQYLTHYWPIESGSMNDVKGAADMSQGNATSYTSDRFGNANSALALNGGWTQVPSGIYFNSPQFTITAWVYPQNANM